MPTYDYSCKECGKKFSKVMLVSEYEKSRVACPKCQSRKVARVLSTFYAKTSKKS
ncbi:MAG: zinc ribbon domain-containing protein [Candidatus Eisenbacteria bacterium]|uniref:Zinc ribbon domain-containing protein n=1 Tax=Eiseniibacteriota bacterium TaxID=2212470 RepID=A0A938BPW1_UNCEI|nr:zinc ribbon domain-containing protein [Candidatus Eisenbacteria bacterium]